jgi:hypothetical protein
LFGEGHVDQIMLLEIEPAPFDLGAIDLRSRLRRLIAPFEPERMTTQVAAIRQELARKSQDLPRLLTAARAVQLAIPADHTLVTAFATLDSLAAVALRRPVRSPRPAAPRLRPRPRPPAIGGWSRERRDGLPGDPGRPGGRGGRLAARPARGLGQ